jgi:hypothetical protein
MKPNLFIGSSSEGQDVAYVLQESLSEDAYVTVWDQGVFNLSHGYLQDLLAARNKFDFAIFVFTPDDIVRIRDEQKVIPRDNVVFETGLFMGSLGADRVFFVKPRGVGDFHLLSDLSGISHGEYDANRPDGNLTAALGPFCNKVRNNLRRVEEEPADKRHTHRVYLTGEPENFDRSKGQYKCHCILFDENSGDERHEDSPLKWEEHGPYAIPTTYLRNVKPNEMVQIRVSIEGQDKIWKSDHFYLSNSTRVCKLNKKTDK